MPNALISSTLSAVQIVEDRFKPADIWEYDFLGIPFPVKTCPTCLAEMGDEKGGADTTCCSDGRMESTPIPPISLATALPTAMIDMHNHEHPFRRPTQISDRRATSGTYFPIWSSAHALG